MNWKKKTLLALAAATALVGVAAGASAEGWDSYGAPQARYDSSRSTYDSDRNDQNRGTRNYAYSGRSYGRAYNGDRGGYWSWNRDTGYSQYYRADRSYGEHRHYESDDDD